MSWWSTRSGGPSPACATRSERPAISRVSVVQVTGLAFTTRVLLSLASSLRPIDDQPVRARLRRPDLARPPEDLTHVRAAAVARKRLELLRLGIEAHHG